MECFWTSDTGSAPALQRVMPDACEDVIWVPGTNSLSAVGAMTRAQVFAHAPRQTIGGVRFRPSMARGYLGVPANELTDRMAGLEELWGARGAGLRRRVSGAENAEELVRLLGAELKPPDAITPLQRLTLFVLDSGGRASVDDMARLAGVSQRHLRRLFLEQTGLTPKMFCRVVRFRNLLNGWQKRGPLNWAERALEAGYYDQSHMVNDFRELGGLTPGEYAMSVFSNTGSPGGA